MKTLVKITVVVAITSLVASCSQQDAASILANNNLRKDIMTSIAGNHEMSMEMMDAMINNEHGKMMMQGNTKMMNMMMGNQEMMQSMMKENPELMHNMMDAMMNATDGDSTNMMYMYHEIKDHPKMMGMMQNMMQGK